MRLAAVGIALGLGLVGLTPVFGTQAQAEYYCSTGFEPSHGGRCIATASRDEVPLYLNDPGLFDGRPVHHRRHHRHGLRTRY